MPPNLQAGYRPLLEAIAFAARTHQGQRRKDGQTPYVSHVFRVCLLVRELFGVSDPAVLAAAVLHDTVEDTDTDHDELARQFGREVADWVAALSKDKRLPEESREQAYGEALAQAPWQVQVCKLADIVDNLLDTDRLPGDKSKPLRNAQRYLAALQTGLKEEARPAWDTVARLVRDVEARGT